MRLRSVLLALAIGAGLLLPTTAAEAKTNYTYKPHKFKIKNYKHAKRIKGDRKISPRKITKQKITPRKITHR